MTVLVFLAFVVIVRVAFRGHLQVPDERREAALKRTEENAIRDKPLLVRSLIVAGPTIVGFLVHSVIGLEPATCLRSTPVEIERERVVRFGNPGATHDAAG